MNTYTNIKVIEPVVENLQIPTIHTHWHTHKQVQKGCPVLGVSSTGLSWQR